MEEKLGIQGATYDFKRCFDAISKHLDIKKYNAWIGKEKHQKQALKEFGEEIDSEEE